MLINYKALVNFDRRFELPDSALDADTLLSPIQSGSVERFCIPCDFTFRARKAYSLCINDVRFRIVCARRRYRCHSSNDLGFCGINQRVSINSALNTCIHIILQDLDNTLEEDENDGIKDSDLDYLLGPSKILRDKTNSGEDNNASEMRILALERSPKAGKII